VVRLEGAPILLAPDDLAGEKTNASTPRTAARSPKMNSRMKPV